MGRIDLPGDFVEGGTKGQVLTLLHMREDQLWKMGGKETPPAPRLLRGREGDTHGKRGDEEVDTVAETFRMEQVTITSTNQPLVVNGWFNEVSDTGVNGSRRARLYHATIRAIETHKGKREDVQGRGGIFVDMQPTIWLVLSFWCRDPCYS